MSYGMGGIAALMPRRRSDYDRPEMMFDRLRSPIEEVDPGPAPAPALRPRLPAAPRDMEEFLTMSPRPMPPLTESVSASPGSGEMPGGVRPTLSTPDPGRAPTPPLRAYSPAYGRYEDERNALPTEPEYLEANKPRGFKQRALSALKLGGKMLIGSGFNPVLGLTGMALGGMDANAHNRMTYRTDVEPRSVARQDRLLRQASGELGMANTVEDNARQQEELDIRRQGLGRALEADEYDRTTMRPLRERKLTSEVTENEAQAERARREPLVKPNFDRLVESGTNENVYFDPVTGKTVRSGVRSDPRETTGRDAPLSEYEASVGPEAYGVSDWNELVDNPEYSAAYNAALTAAGSQEELNKAITYGDVKLPAPKIPAYEYARRNPHPGKQAAVGARNRDRGSKRLGARPQRSGGGAKPAGKRKVSAQEVKAFADANNWTPDQAASYLRSTGKYIVQ